MNNSKFSDFSVIMAFVALVVMAIIITGFLAEKQKQQLADNDKQREHQKQLAKTYNKGLGNWFSLFGKYSGGFASGAGWV